MYISSSELDALSWEQRCCICVCDGSREKAEGNFETTVQERKRCRRDRAESRERPGAGGCAEAPGEGRAQWCCPAPVPQVPHRAWRCLGALGAPLCTARDEHWSIPPKSKHKVCQQNAPGSPRWAVPSRRGTVPGSYGPNPVPASLTSASHLLTYQNLTSQ